MEITAGKAAGFRITAPDGMKTRPTAVRARKALFDSLGDLSGKHTADLFAGSGALGLESLSRGADSCIFVESSASALHCIRKNLAKAAGFLPDAGSEVIQGTLPGCAKRLSSFREADLIFADPPYEQSAELLDALLRDQAFTGWAEHSLLIWETDAERGGLKPPPEPWNLVQIRTFGSARFLFLSQTAEETEP